MRCASASLALSVVLLSPAVLRADDKGAKQDTAFVFTIAKKADKLECHRTASPRLKTGGLVFVRLVHDPELHLTVEFSGRDKKKIDVPEPDRGIYTIEPEQAEEAKDLTVKFLHADKTLAVECGAIAIVPIADAPDPDAATGDWGAYLWLETPSGKAAFDDLKQRLKRQKLISEGTKFLFHLPSGRPMYPFPSAVTEGVTMQVVMVVPKDDTRLIDMKLEDCEAVSHFRTETRPPDTDGKHRGEGTPGGESKQFVIAPVGKAIRCGAGEVHYTLRDRPGKNPGASSSDAPAARARETPAATPNATLLAATTGEPGATAPGPDGSGDTSGPGQEGGSKAPDPDANVLETTTLRFRPKFHLGAIALLGWDTAERVSFSARTASGDAMPTIAEHEDRAGAEVYVGAVWMIGGVDYEEMRWFNHVSNLFVAADPTNPLTDFAAGVAITPTGGISLGLGLSFHKGSALDGPSVGDIFAGEGDVPTRSSWSAGSFGLVVGLTIDSKIYEALIAHSGK